MFGSKGWFVMFLVLATGAIVGGLLGDVLLTSQALGSGTSFLVQDSTTHPVTMLMTR